MKKTSLILIVIFAMVIGYGSLNVTKYINANVRVGMNLENVDLYIGNIFEDEVNKFGLINEDLTSFSFDVKKSSGVLKYYIRNNSLEYDMNIDVTCSEVDSSKIVVTNEYDNIVKAQEIMVGTISTKVNDENEYGISCKVSYKLQERTEPAIKTKVVFFAADGSIIKTPYKIYTSETVYGNLETPIKTGYTFKTWKNKDDKEINSNTSILSDADEILYSAWNNLYARNVEYDNGVTSLNCETIQCALEEINNKVERKIK